MSDILKGQFFWAQRAIGQDARPLFVQPLFGPVAEKTNAQHLCVVKLAISKLRVADLGWGVADLGWSVDKFNRFSLPHQLMTVLSQ